jgi:hypothetical protein
MRLKDLNTTTVYAYRRSPRGYAEKVMVVDASTLYTTKFRESGHIPAREGQRANMSSSYHTRSCGVLVRWPDKPDSSNGLVMPAQIVGTWEEISKEEDQAKAERLAAQKSMDDWYAQNARDAQRAKELMSQHPEFFPGPIYVDSRDSKQKIKTTTLIQLLEALPHA